MSAATNLPRAARVAVFALAGAAAAACDQEAPPAPVQVPVQASSRGAAAHVAATLTRRDRQQLAELRAATAPFHDIGAATAAGFRDRLTDCMSDPTLGAMGVHYGDLTRFDAKPEYARPEILVYEPRKNGRLRLVAVEFAVPFDAWTANKAPVLFGQSFHRNETFGLWVLHVWLWRDNPSGLFADWNPRVSCERAR